MIETEVSIVISTGVEIGCRRPKPPASSLAEALLAISAEAPISLTRNTFRVRIRPGGLILSRSPGGDCDGTFLCHAGGWNKA